MKKTIKLFNNILSIKLVGLILIPILLLFFWFFCSLILNNKISFSVLLYEHSKNDLRNLPEGKLLKGDKIKGEFTAKDNNLGLISLKFDQFARHDFISEEVLLFKLKERNDSNWYYVNNYRARLLDNNLSLLIGFPLISNSKDKIYQFEIQSLLGTDSNALEISRKKTALFSGYQYSRSAILQNYISTSKFLINKTKTSFTNLDFLLNSLLYLIPLLIYIATYLALFSSYSNKVVSYKYNWTLVLLILAPIDIFLVHETYNGLILFVLLSWIFYVIINKLGSRHSFIFSLILISIWIGLVSLHINKFQNKINTYSYAFLIIGTIQAVLEERAVKKFVKNKTL